MDSETKLDENSRKSLRMLDEMEQHGKSRTGSRLVVDEDRSIWALVQSITLHLKSCSVSSEEKHVVVCVRGSMIHRVSRILNALGVDAQCADSQELPGFVLVRIGWRWQEHAEEVQG